METAVPPGLMGLQRIDRTELDQRKPVVSPVEIIEAARGSIPKVTAPVPKNKQAAVRPKIDFHVAQVVQRHVQ